MREELLVAPPPRRLAGRPSRLNWTLRGRSRLALGQAHSGCPGGRQETI